MDYDAVIAQAAQHYGVEVKQLLGHALRDSGEVVLILPDGKKVVYTSQPENRAVQEEKTTAPEEVPAEVEPEAEAMPQSKPQRAKSRKKAT